MTQVIFVYIPGNSEKGIEKISSEHNYDIDEVKDRNKMKRSPCTWPITYNIIVIHLTYCGL